jgi:hypothetical protein
LSDFWWPAMPATTATPGHPRKGWLCSLRGVRHPPYGLALIGLVYLLAAGTPSSAQNVTFKRMEDVSAKAAKQFKNDFFLRKETLEEYLTSTNFTQLFSGNFEVEVFPKQMHSEALLFAWDGNRGHIYFPPHRVKGRDAAILHEIAHVHAPNAVRFLAEGFPAYLEEKMGSIDAYPAQGSRIECAVGDYNKQYNSALASVKLDLFDRVPTKRTVFLGDHMGLEPAFAADRTEGEGRRRTYSYLVSSSFVKFLIHNHGQSRFKALYDSTPLIPMDTRQVDPGRYQSIYGKSLTELQTGWLSWLSNRQALCL